MSPFHILPLSIRTDPGIVDENVKSIGARFEFVCSFLDSRKRR